MEKKINIAKLLKDCPKGMELYSPLCGECRVLSIYDGLGFDVICGDDTVYNFSYDGRYNIMGECCIFPSKENRDWSKFQRPFKDGDIVVGENCACGYITIFRKFIDDTSFSHHACLTGFGKFKIDDISDNANLRFATKEEKEKLFDAIKDNGYKWNPETKTLEKLPKFKVGDKIKRKGVDDIYVDEITTVEQTIYTFRSGSFQSIEYIDKNYELIPNKFDITTLKPFDKVLVRANNSYWRIQFFEKINKKNKNYPFVCMSGNNYKQCIPYEGNEHLLGTTDNCNEYFKTW